MSTLVAACALSACASHQSASTRFNPANIAWSKQAGPNAIAGIAQLETGDGKLKTCASLPVHLAPDSTYTRKRVELLYGDTQSGFVDAQDAHRVRAKPGATITKAYERSLKASVCDRQGRFAFKNLPSGTYYVMAPVVWRNKAGEVKEGGFFMQRITIGGGETRHITMTL
ncbi:MAG: hypothetical protein ABL973_10600 [Micropepsaceae bacterium]